MDRVTILSLPHELLIKIFGHLDTGSLKTVALLGPFFNEIIDNDEIWKVLFIKKLIKNDEKIDLDCLPGKNKTSKHQVTLNTENVVDRSSMAITSFPSLSKSWYWKDEFNIRFTYLKKIITLNKNKKVGNSKDLKSGNYRKLHPYLITSVYKIHSNYLIDDLIGDFTNDRLILYSNKTQNLNLLSLKQGKKIYQGDSHLSHATLAQYSMNQIHYSTFKKLCKKLVIIGNSKGLIFLKSFSSTLPLISNLSEGYLGAHEDVELSFETEKQLMWKKKFISYVETNPALDSSNNSNVSKTSLDILSGDLNGQIYGWNYTGKIKLFNFNINDFVNYEDYKNISKDISFPVLKIQSNFKRYVVVESINKNFFIIEFKFDNNTYKFKSTHIRLDSEESESKKILFEIFNKKSVHLLNDLSPVALDKIVNPRNLNQKTFLDIDYANNKFIFSSKSEVIVTDFTGYRSDTVDIKLDSDHAYNKEYVTQTKIINNQYTKQNSQTFKPLSGNNSPLHVVLFSSGKILIHSTVKNDDDKSSIIIKVIPRFLKELFGNDSFENYNIQPILKFDCNSVVLLLCSYNGWMALVNPLNGEILRIIEDKIPNTLTQSTPYTLTLNDVNIAMQSNNENRLNLPITNINGNLTLLPVTGVQLAKIPNLNKNENDMYVLPPVLISGIVVLDNIVQYFQISFENSLFVKNILTGPGGHILSEEEVFQRQQDMKKRKNFKYISKTEIEHMISLEMEEVHYRKQQNDLQDLLLEKYNGDHELTEQEEMMLAMAISESLHDDSRQKEEEEVKKALVSSLDDNDQDDDDDLKRALEASRVEEDVYDDELAKEIRIALFPTGAENEDEEDNGFFGLSKAKFKFLEDNFSEDENEDNGKGKQIVDKETVDLETTDVRSEIDEDLLSAIELSKQETSSIGSTSKVILPKTATWGSDVNTTTTATTTTYLHSTSSLSSIYCRPPGNPKPLTKNSKNKIKQKYKKLDLDELDLVTFNDLNDEDEELRHVLLLSTSEQTKPFESEDEELNKILELSKFDQ